MLQNQIEAIAKKSEIINSDIESQMKILNEELQSDEYFLRFQISDSSGNFTSTDGKTFWDGGSSWFSTAITGKTAISDVQFYHDLFGLEMILDNDGNPKGVLAGIVSSGILNQITQAVDLNYDGRCFIINPAGAKMSGTTYSDGQDTLENDLYNSEAAPGGSLEQLALVEKRMIQGEEGLTIFREGNKEYYISYGPINNGQWYLGIIQDRKQARAVMNSLAGSMSLLLYSSTKMC